jgi:Large polyvalent protein associated domain 38
MMDNFNPNAETIAGNAVPDAGSQLEHVSRTGQPTLLHDAYGGRGSAANPNKYGQGGLPPLDEYLQHRALTDDPKNPQQLSTVDPSMAAGWANDYATTFIPAAMEAAYKSKVDKNLVNAEVAKFGMQFANNWPALQKHFADLDNANTAAKPPAGPSAMDTVKALGQTALGGLETGTSQAVAGLPGLLGKASIATDPLGSSLKIGELLKQGKTPGEIYNILTNPVTEATSSVTTPIANKLRAAGKTNLEANPEVAKAHPWLTAGASVVGQAGPYIAESLTGPAAIPLMMGTGASQSGGAAKQEEIDRLMAMPQEEFNKLPTYQTLLKQIGDPTLAKAALIKKSSDIAENIGEPFGAVMGVIGGGAKTKIGENIITKLGGEAGLKRILASAGVESAGFAGQQVAQNVATTAGTNAATGETREGDATAGAGQAGAVGAVIGALTGHKGPNVLKTPKPSVEEVKPSKPGEPPASVGNAPVAADAYTKAAHATLADPDLHVEPGTPEEKVIPVLTDALENFEGHLNQHAPDMAPEAKAAALTQFEKDYREKFGVPAPEGANAVENAPASAPAAEAPVETPVSAEEAASAAGTVTPEAEAAQAAEAIPAAGEPRAPEPAAAVHNEIEPPTPEEALQARGAVHENAPELPARSARELATQPGVDTRLPFGVTEPIIEHLQQELGREPTADEINKAAHDKLGRIVQAVQQAHPDVLSVSPIARREAIGQLIAEGKTATPEEVLKRAQKMIAEGTVQSTINDRIAEHEKGPKAEAAARAEAQAAKEKNNAAFRDVLKKTDVLAKEREAREAAARAKEEADRKEAQAKEDTAKTKAEADLKEEAARHAAENTPEKDNQRLKNLLKKIDDDLAAEKAAEKKPPKPEAAEQGSDAAKDSTEFDQAAHDDLVKAGADPVATDKLLKWLRDRAPHLFSDLKFELQDKAPPGKRGTYLPLEKIARIFLDKRSPDTMIHEVMHHLERLMPSDVQKGIIDAWKQAIDKEIANAKKAGDTQRVENLEKQKALRIGSDNKPAYDAYRQALADHAGNPERLMGEYALTNPSEYWATNAARIISERANATGWIGKARQWLKEFIEHAKAAFGMKSDAPILNALRDLMNGKSSEIQPGTKMLANRVREFNQMTTDEKADYIAKAWSPHPLKQPIQSLREKVRDLAEKTVNEYKPWQNYNRDQEKAGHFIRPDQDVFKALTLARGAGDVKANADRAEVLEPFMNKMAQLAKSLGIESAKLKDFIANATNGVTARHALERNKVHYMETVRLTPEAEKLRQPLLLDTYTKKMEPGEYLKKLREIVYAPDARIEKGGVRAASGIPDDVAYKMLKNVDDAGVSQETIDKVNQALQPIRERSLKNGIESGRYTEDERRLLEAKGFKYYMPLKGFAEELPSPTNPSQRPLGAFNRDTKYMEGRSTLSDNPLENLLADLNTSSKDISANQLVARSAYFAASDPSSKLGAVIRHYNMDKMYKEALAAGSVDFNGQSRRQYWTEKLKKAYQNPNTIIYNAGKDKYVIEFPEGSKQLRALKAAQAANDLDGLYKTAGKLTNFYARVHTAFSPAFSIITAPIRDILSYPLMIGFDKGIRATAEYAASAVKYGGPFGAWKNYVDFGRLKGRSIDEIRQLAAKQKPDSFANRLIQLSDLGGGFSFTDELSKARDAAGVADAIAKMQKNGLTNPKALLHRFGNFLDSFATGSLMAGRVAAFDALLKRGVEPSEAALYAKRLLNFQQTSEYGRKFNSLYAFFRAGITNADRTTELFRNHDGSFNGQKLAAAAALGTGAMAAWYQMLLAKYGDDKMKEIEDSTMAGNFILPWEGADGHPMKIPMGLGLPRMMFGLGMLATRYAHGHTTMTSAAQTALNTAIENMTPARPIQSQSNESTGDKALDLAMALVPSAARAPAELGVNRNSFGTPIHNQDYGDETKFKSESGRASTPELFKEIAQGLNKIAGVDVYPESLQHLTNEWGPGVVTDALRGYALHAEGAPLSKYPGISTLTATDSERAGDKQFYGARDNLQEAVKEANLLKSENKPVPASLQRQLTEQDKLKKAAIEHSKEVKAVQSNKLLTPEAKATRVEQIKQRWSIKERQLAAEAARVNP